MNSNRSVTKQQKKNYLHVRGTYPVLGEVSISIKI